MGLNFSGVRVGFFCAVFSIVLSACGGGSGGESNSLKNNSGSVLGDSGSIENISEISSDSTGTSESGAEQTNNSTPTASPEPDSEPETEPEPTYPIQVTQPEPEVLLDGTWGEVIQWPHIPVHIANLPDGKLLTWASYFPEAFYGRLGDGTVSAVFDPQTGNFVSTNNDRHDMFCAGISLLEDGTIMTTGGNMIPLQNSASLFDLGEMQWKPAASMNSPRWYGTSLTLGNGDVFTSFALGAEEFGELYSTKHDTWTNLPGTDMTTLQVEEAIVDSEAGNGDAAQWYSYLHVAPDGKVFQAGPTNTMHLFSTDGSGMVEEVGPRPLAPDRHVQFGTSTNYAIGKLLVTGGGDLRKTTPSTNEAMIVDLNGASPQSRKIAPMKRARTFHDAVVMVNGEVIIIGGNTNAMVFNDEGSQLVSEIFNPDTETWRDAAAISVKRNYHSVGLLMKDGRVISAGGGLCGCSANHPDAQIYTPGYLYNLDGSLADRPTITAMAAQANPGDDVTINTDSDAYRFTAIRLSGTTHSINTEQRFIDLDFSKNASDYTLHLHDNPNVLIPGNYWVFAFNEQGVPSIGATLNIKAQENLL